MVHGTSDKFQVICKEKSKSFINIRKSKGPRTVPWGTPDETLKYLEYVDPTLRERSHMTVA